MMRLKCLVHNHFSSLAQHQHHLLVVFSLPLETGQTFWANILRKGRLTDASHLGWCYSLDRLTICLFIYFQWVRLLMLLWPSVSSSTKPTLESIKQEHQVNVAVWKKNCQPKPHLKRINQTVSDGSWNWPIMLLSFVLFLSKSVQKIVSQPVVISDWLRLRQDWRR